MKTLTHLALVLAMIACSRATAQEPERSGPWLIERTANADLVTLTAELTLHAAVEPTRRSNIV